MWSYFEDLDVRNTMVQLKFNLNICSEIYGFFLFQTCLYVRDIILLSFLDVCICASSLHAAIINSGPYLTSLPANWIASSGDETVLYCLKR